MPMLIGRSFPPRLRHKELSEHKGLHDFESFEKTYTRNFENAAPSVPTHRTA